MYNREKIQTWTQLGSCFSAQVSGGLFALLPNVLFAQVPGGLFRTNQDHFLGFRHWETIVRHQFFSRAIIQFGILQHVFHSATYTLRRSWYGWSRRCLRFGFRWASTALNIDVRATANEPKKAGPFLFFTNIDLVVQAVVNWLFCFGHVLKPVREIGRILQSAFGFWGGIACTIEFWGLFFISPGLVQVKDQTFSPRYHWN